MAEKTPESESTTLNLRNDVTINGVKYRAGRNVRVPKAQAADIERIDFEHDEYKSNLMKRRKYEVDSGTMSVGQ